MAQAQTPAPDQTFLAIEKDFVWNKWDTTNFIVLSIDKSQGVYLKNNIERMKSDFENKWKIRPLNFSTPCKLICVSNENLLERFFNINEPHSEVRRDAEGKISLLAIWMQAENQYDLPKLIANVCLENLNSSTFVQRGIHRLQSSIDSLRSDFSNSLEIEASKIIKTTKSDWNSFSPEEKNNYDRSAAILCFMLRRELGIDKFSLFLNSKQDESSLISIYGFKDISGLSDTLSRYSKNLSKDISDKKTPDEYFDLDNK